MISLDSNVVFSAITADDTLHGQARSALSAFADQGFALSPLAYAELKASAGWKRIEGFINEVGIQVLWEMPPSVWERAGDAFGQYARLRRGGSLPRRIVGDFLIAAHAEHHALDVLTFDDTVYKAVFPKLKLKN